MATRRQSAKQLIQKFGDVAKYAINVGARAERRAMRDHLNREIADAESKGDAALRTLQTDGWSRARASNAAVARSRIDTLYAVKSWLGGRVERTKKTGGIGRK